MSNLKSGDFAEIVKSLDGHCTGKIVQCIQVEYINHPEYGTIWLVQSTTDDLVTEYGGVGDNLHVPEIWLRKIPKDKINDLVLENDEQEVRT